MLAQDFANKYPGKVRSLTALAGYDINNYDPSMDRSQRKVQIGFMLKALFSMSWFSKSNAKISAYTEQAQNKFYEMNMQFKRSSLSYMSSLGNIMNQSKARLNVPLLIMYGEHDAEITAEFSKNWFSNRPESKLVVIKDAGHCANMDNPEEFNRELMIFLEENGD